MPLFEMQGRSTDLNPYAVSHIALYYQMVTSSSVAQFFFSERLGMRPAHCKHEIPC